MAEDVPQRDVFLTVFLTVLHTDDDVLLISQLAISKTDSSVERQDTQLQISQLIERLVNE